MKPRSHAERIEITFPGELGYEAIAREVVASFAQRVGLVPERIADMKTALGEAYINAVEHGNQLDPHLTIDIICTYDDHQLCIEVYDQGCKPFAPDATPLSIDEKLAGLGPLRGMGLMLMTQLADEASFLPAPDGGNCCRLVWYCQSPAASS